MEKELIKYIYQNIDIKECQTAYDNMCEHKASLKFANYNLYTTINDLIRDFIVGSNLDDDCFNIELNAEHIFEKLFDYMNNINYVSSEIKVFYCFSDYIDEFSDDITLDDCYNLVNEGKGEMYRSLKDFQSAFNTEMISDLGYIKFFQIH